MLVGSLFPGASLEMSRDGVRQSLIAWRIASTRAGLVLAEPAVDDTRGDTTMVQSVSPEEARSLIASGEVDVIDGREHREWLTGHIPGARLVPLAEFRANPAVHLKSNQVVFVCAAGVRSLLAAQVARSVGLEKAYNLHGGTRAWASLGLALVDPSVLATG
jgi:rhodanese-related sulfurtransferase